MSEVTQDMILDYLIKKGGSVRNVDLVRHFRKFLQNESTPEKDRARVLFKERVNTVAFIKADKQEKYLHIRPEFVPAGGLIRPPPGPIIPGSERTSVSSMASLEDVIAGREPSNRHDPQSQLHGKQTTQNSRSYILDSRFSDSDQMKLGGVTATSSPPPPVTSSNKTTPPSSAGKSKLIDEDDFGSSLMSELNTFGNLLDSFGLSGGSSTASTGINKATPISYAAGKSSPASANVAPLSKPPAASTGNSNPYSSKYDAYSSNASSAGSNTRSYTSNTPSYASNTPSYTNNTPSYASNTPSNASNTPSYTNNTPSQSAHVVPQTGPTPLGQAPVGISSITRFSPPRSGVNNSPSHSSKAGKKSVSRGQTDIDLVLTSVLSSLPSAKPTSFGRSTGKPPSGAGKSGMGKLSSGSQPSTGRPDQPRVGQTGYQNSTKFVQPALPSQPNYQNSTKFVQPALPSQSGYHGSSLLMQPAASLQPSYQGSGTIPDSYHSVPPQAMTSQLGFDERALAALTTNVPQPTNPQPLPPVGPSYKPSAFPAAVTALQPVPPPVAPTNPPYNSDLQQSSYEPQSMGHPSQVSAAPHSEENQMSVSTAPRAPVRSSSISQATRNSSTSQGTSSSTSPGMNNSTSQAARSSTSQGTSSSTSLGTNNSISQAARTRSISHGTNSSTSPGTNHSISQSNRTRSISQGSHSHSSQKNRKISTVKESPAPSSASSSHYAPHRAAPPPPLATNSGHALGHTHTSTSMLRSHGNAMPLDYTQSTGSPNSASLDLGGSMEFGDMSSFDLPGSQISSSVPADGFLSTNYTLSESDFGRGLDSPILHSVTHSLAPGGGVARSHQEGESYRPGSVDSNPSIHVDSCPSGESGTTSPNHGEEQRGASSYGVMGVVAPAPGLVHLRNNEGRRVGPGPLFRRSKNFERNANLENVTRLSITMTPPSVRKHGSTTPPDVAPKPVRPSSGFYGSQQDIGPQYLNLHPQQDMDEQEEYENDYADIDPLEKEWMLAGAQANLDTIHRLLLTEPSLINRRGFLHGYSAMHWAAKHGRMDILTMLLIQGASPNIKSGLTPLHLAAQAGHENVVLLLVTDHEANINLRENGGRRAIDMLNNKVSGDIKDLLSQLNNHGLPIRIENTKKLSTFTQPRNPRSTLDRNWGPVNEVNQDFKEKDKAPKKRLSPRSSLKKSFSFKTKHRFRDQTPPPRNKEKKLKKSSRPVSEGASHLFDV